MAYGKRAYKRKYGKYKRKYKRSKRSYGSKRKYGRSYKKSSRKSNVLLPVPNRYYKVSISRGEYKRLKYLWKSLVKLRNGDKKMDRKDYKKNGENFMLTATLSGLTTTIDNHNKSEQNEILEAAMKRTGMTRGGGGSSSASDEPIEPGSAEDVMKTGGQVLHGMEQAAAGNYVGALRTEMNQAGHVLSEVFGKKR